MKFDEFMQTKFAGFLFCCIAFFTTLWFVHRSAEASGYMRGIQENPKNRDIHTYVFAVHADGAGTDHRGQQMSDTTITSEERRLLRSGGYSDYVRLRLLNALEQAEANVERLTKERDWLANQLYCPSEFTNCAVDCAECRKEAARRAVAAVEEPCQK